MARGIKMTALAKMAGLSLSAMSKIEKGVRRLNQTQLMQLCGILNCKLSDIFVKADDAVAGKWQSEMTKRLNDNGSNGLLIFGAGLRMLRKKSGKTISQMAASSGMSLSVYHKLEVGQRDMYEGEIDQIASALGKNPAGVYQEIAKLFESGKLENIISKSNDKTSSVIIPDSPLSGAELAGNLYGAKIYENVRKKLVPVYAQPDDKRLKFCKSDERMIALPGGLAGNMALYAVIPLVRRMAGMFPGDRAYFLVDSAATVQPGDLAVCLDKPYSELKSEECTGADIVNISKDSRGKLYGRIWSPDEKIPINMNSGKLHKVIRIIID
jgi:transcriptional regulator with XRE-family HTH domain